MTSIDYRELHRIEQRIKQIRTYLKDISPRTIRYKELKVEEKQLVTILSKLAV